MKRAVPFAAIVLSLGATQLAAATASTPPSEPLRVFLRAGLKTHNPVDNGEHDYPAFLGAWSNLLLERGARVDGALHFPSSAELAATDVLVVYKGDGGMLSPVERASLDSYLERGGGLVILHDGMCSDDAAWFATVAGAAKQHGEPNWSRGLLNLHVTDTAHPITRGLADFELRDESFYMLRRRPEMHVLLEAPRPDTGVVEPQAWTYERTLPGGQPYRSFVWMQGHYTAELMRPRSRDLILRGIAWAGRRPAEELLAARRQATALPSTPLAIAAPTGDSAIPFPDGYKRWVHVKTTRIGPEAPGFARNGGVHHFYANADALEGYSTGKFPDGSVLIDDGLEAKEAAGVTTDGPRKRVAVMAKDAQRFASTGGWGFEMFMGDGHRAALSAEDKTSCFACHTKASRDSVFSELAP